jgi:hypothetical protein
MRRDSHPSLCGGGGGTTAVVANNVLYSLMGEPASGDQPHDRVLPEVRHVECQVIERQFEPVEFPGFMRTKTAGTI